MARVGSRTIQTSRGRKLNSFLLAGWTRGEQSHIGILQLVSLIVRYVVVTLTDLHIVGCGVLQTVKLGHMLANALVVLSSTAEDGEIEVRFESRSGYVTTILDDARVFATHAKKKIIDLDDTKLAVQMTVDRTFTTPPPRDTQQKQLMYQAVSGGGFHGNTLAHSMINSGAGKLQNKQQQGLSIVKRPGTLSTVARTQTITIPKPVIKFSSGTTTPKTITKPKIQISTSSLPTQSMKMDTDDNSGGMVRKQEDDDYDVE
uniref:Uncharacterized protein n=1 Tax=Timema genevievae TaxID=629358 RepID=A0A7R9JXA0_TIMGE|nr:unnamed protein product [Timema genevievae]